MAKESVSRTAAWRRIAVSIFTALAFTAGINFAFSTYITENPINTGISRVWQKWRMLERMELPVDWVVIGDSTCGQSVRPDLIKSETGETVANLCTVGNALVTNGVWQVQRYIDRFGPPRRVVALFAFETFERDGADLKSLLNQIPLQYGFWRNMPAKLPLTSGEEAQRLLQPFYSLYAYNLSAKALIRNLLDGQVASSAWRDLEGIERAQGFVMETRGEVARVLRESEIAAVKADGRVISMTPENKTALRALVAMSDEFGFDLYVANAPIAQRLYADRRFRPYFNSVNAELGAIVSQGRASRLIFEVPVQFPDEQLSDHEHIIGEAATAELTRRLVVEMRRLDANAETEAK